MSGAPAAQAPAGPWEAAPVVPAAWPLAEGWHVLAVDTTSDVLSLAVLRDGQPAGACYDAIGRRTTQEILPRVDGLLRGAGLRPADLQLLVVARGPGSFTGTRIGMAVALTMAEVTGCPLVGVDTLHLLAAQTAPTLPGRFHALLNCARDEVYWAPFRWEGGALAMLQPMALRGIAGLSAEIAAEPVVLRRFNPGGGTTEAAEAAFAVLTAAPLAHRAPDAERLLAVGVGRYRSAAGAAAHPVEPIYLKSEAFRTWRPPQ